MVLVTYLTPYEKLEKVIELLSQCTCPILFSPAYIGVCQINSTKYLIDLNLSGEELIRLVWRIYKIKYGYLISVIFVNKNQTSPLIQIITNLNNTLFFLTLFPNSFHLV